MSPSLISRLVRKNDSSQSNFITIVSGLPRSGTSMMMKMLDAGGLPVVTDQLRTADEDNPKGYYEFERVKKLKDGDWGWVPDAQGKVVKIISALLEHLPPDYTYKVVFMRRNMPEILASQKQMLVRRNEPTDRVSDEQMAEFYTRHLAKIELWLDRQPNIEVLYIHYNELLANPEIHLEKMNRFLGSRLDLERMGPVIDKNLYRQRT